MQPFSDTDLYPYIDYEQVRLDRRSRRILELGGILHDPMRVYRWAQLWRHGFSVSQP